MSNLSYVRKLVEKVAINRFSGHVEVNDINELIQLAYKEHYSVETALVKVYDDLCAVDSKNMILIALLDLLNFNDDEQAIEVLWCVLVRGLLAVP